MRVYLNGRELSGLDASLERRLSGGLRGAGVEAVTLTPAGSIAARARQLRLILGAAAAFVAVTLGLNLTIVAARAPQAMGLVALIVAAAGAVTLGVVFLVYALMLGAHRRRVEARTDPGLAPDTLIAVDATGLTIAGQLWPWASLSVSELAVRQRQGEHQRVTYVERLALSDGRRGVVLDALFLTNGRTVLEQAWRRLAVP